MTYELITTNAYAERIALAAAGETLLLNKIAFGDGILTPSEETEALQNEVYRADIEEKGAILTSVWAKARIPADEGGWWVREIGLYGRIDGEGADVLLASAVVSDNYKPLLAVGENKDVWYRVMIDNVPAASLAGISFIVDESLALLTLNDLNAYLAADRLAADYSTTIATHELMDTLAAIPKNLNGHTVTITISDLLYGDPPDFAEYNLSEHLYIKGFFGGKLRINFSDREITLGAYNIVILQNDAEIHLDGISILGTGTGHVYVNQNRLVTIEDMTFEVDAGFSSGNHVYIDYGGPVLFTGTTEMSGKNGADNIVVSSGAVCMVMGTYNFSGNADTALYVLSGGKAASLATQIGWTQLFLAAGAKYHGKFNRHFCNLKANTNIAAVPRAGQTHFVYDSAGTTKKGEIMVIAVRDGYIYYQVTAGEIPTDANVYTIKLVEDAGEPWIAEVAGDAGSVHHIEIAA